MTKKTGNPADVFYKDSPQKKLDEKKIKRTPSFELLEKHLKRISAPNTPKGLKESEPEGIVIFHHNLLSSSRF